MWCDFIYFYRHNMCTTRIATTSICTKHRDKSRVYTRHNSILTVCKISELKDGKLIDFSNSLWPKVDRSLHGRKREGKRENK